MNKQCRQWMRKISTLILMLIQKDNLKDIDFLKSGTIKEIQHISFNFISLDLYKDLLCD